ncbi:hypothetical protein EVAR_32687_1 [Eumeta japonica]|uniref:Uncharacterized protein n=1 Tax=Eumeta variegata TaxID=151549 RepID=A0A4C1VS47_EUMVA|nr:hypothetical protein EVAR_32687_1 [Eumeta japonica]
MRKSNGKIEERDVLRVLMQKKGTAWRGFIVAPRLMRVENGPGRALVNTDRECGARTSTATAVDGDSAVGSLCLNALFMLWCSPPPHLHPSPLERHLEYPRGLCTRRKQENPRRRRDRGFN